MKSLVKVVAVTAALASVALTSFTTAGAVGAPANTPGSGYAFGQEALDHLAGRLPQVAAAYGLNPGQLQKMLLDDGTLAIDNEDQLAYFDVQAPNERARRAAPGGDVAAAPPLTDPVFGLASLPGATKTIFLDFDGHVTEGTSWNSNYGVATITSPPYDTDGDPNSWSSSELNVIRKSWEAVAEDYAPWNVNVTTVDPGTEALRYSGAGDAQWGARVVITKDTFANCGCGGHAYIGAFDDPTDEPTFVYNSSLAGVKEAISHEVGHMLNLAHDGTSSTTYYQGHGSGATSWAPIMGAAYYVSVSQWSQQEFYGANNNLSSSNYGYGADDIAVISSMTNGNGFGLKADDHGDSAASATALASTSPSVSGIIGTRSDVDAFAFSAGAGTVSFTASPAPSSPNLDIKLTLRNSAGDEIASSNPTTALTATVSATVTAGSYTVEVDGVGVGSPASNPPTGYSDYASIGQFSLTGTVPSPTTTDTTAPVAPTGLGATAVTANMVTLAWNANTESDLASYRVLRKTGTGSYAQVGTVGAGATSFDDTGVQPASTYVYVITATDTSNNTSLPSNEASVTTPSAPAPTNVIVNPGFENGLTGWSNSGVRTTVSGTSHSGSSSALLGSSAPKKVESKLIQSFTAPTGTSTLSFWYDMTCNDVVKNDFAKATLYDLDTRKTVTIMKVCTKGAGWVERTTPVIAGHRYTLTLSNKDNGVANTASFTYFDDVVVS